MRFYHILLHLFPAAFRAEYGEEMCWIFSQRLKDASGPVAKFVLWLGTFWEVAVNAIRTHWDIFRQDLRYTARTLRRTPGFTLTAILVTALGVGATTAAFSITDHVLIRPLPFRDWQRLVRIWEAPEGYSSQEASPPTYRDWRRMSKSFETMGAFTTASMNLIGQGEPERLEGVLVSAEVLPILGMQPVIGRLFTSADDRTESSPTLLLSYGLWQRRFNGDAGILGKKVILDDVPYEVIGVMPQSFYFPGREERFWTPIRFQPGDDYEDRNNHYLQVLAKLKKNVSLEEAQSEMRLIAKQLEQEYPEENARTTAKVILWRDAVSRQARFLLFALVGAAMCVLLIACANLANLLLARSVVRRKELAVRTALGAGRERLVRQLFTESLFLVVLGGTLGILLAIAVTPLLAQLVPTTLPIAEAPSMDLRVLIFAALATAFTGIGFGVIPALRISRDTDVKGLHEGSRGGIGGRRERLRSALIIGEVTASVVLLISSGLLLHALWRIQTTNPGFRTENVLTLRTWLPLPKYETAARRTAFYSRVLLETRALPNVTNAAYISFLPMLMRGGIRSVTIPGRVWEPGETHNVSMRFTTDGFFDTMRIPMIQGRDVMDSDTLESNPVVIVSQSFVPEYFPGQSPLGRKVGVQGQERTIVGVVGDIRVRGLEQDSEPQVYLPQKQQADRESTFYVPKDLVIRSENAAALIPALRQIVRNADPDQPISDIQMLSEIVDGETAPRSTQLRVIGAFAVIAVLLAGIGIHGLLSYAVSQRTQEFGVRIALGAQRGAILKLVLREGILLAVSGIFVGVAVAYVAGRAMEALLAGVKPADPGTFVIAIVLSFVMTIAGSLFPALRALRVDPTTAIRAE